VLSTLVTFMPFTIVAAISAITAWTFSASACRRRRRAWVNCSSRAPPTCATAPWIVMSAFGTLVALLTLVTFIGEAVRESFDPKTFSVYR
jgi:microcin C transport system permease protein